MARFKQKQKTLFGILYNRNYFFYFTTTTTINHKKRKQKNKQKKPNKNTKTKNKTNYNKFKKHQRCPAFMDEDSQSKHEKLKIFYRN